MSTATKADLARAGTMELTAKEGEGYLEKNLTTWKKPLLMNHFDEKDNGESGSTSKIAKHTTMAGTAEEAKALLDGEVLGDTRQETKKKKQSLARNSPKTNVASTKRTSTIDKALEEAKAVYNDLDTSGEGRSLRKRSSSSSPKKSPAVKRAGTMLKTAEEGKEFVKRGGKKASAKKGKKAAAASDDDADD